METKQEALGVCGPGRSSGSYLGERMSTCFVLLCINSNSVIFSPFKKVLWNPQILESVAKIKRCMLTFSSPIHLLHPKILALVYHLPGTAFVVMTAGEERQQGRGKGKQAHTSLDPSLVWLWVPPGGWSENSMQTPRMGRGKQFCSFSCSGVPGSRRAWETCQSSSHAPRCMFPCLSSGT